MQLNKGVIDSKKTNTIELVDFAGCIVNANI